MIKSPYATQFTRTGVIDLNNYKPYRNAALKKLARANAVKTDGGTYKSSAPKMRHPVSENLKKGIAA